MLRDALAMDDLYPLRAAICDHLLEPVYSSDSDLSEEDTQATIHACSDFLNREDPLSFLTSIAKSADHTAKGKRYYPSTSFVPKHILSSRFPLMTHLAVWLLQNQTARALELIRHIETAPNVDDICKDESYLILWNHLLLLGQVFLDGNDTETREYLERRELLYNDIANGMGPYGRESMMDFYQSLAQKVWDMRKATLQEKHYILVASQQTLLRLCLKCHGLGNSTIVNFLKDTKWPVACQETVSTSATQVQEWAIAFLRHSNHVPKSLLSADGAMDLSPLLEPDFDGVPADFTPFQTTTQPKGINSSSLRDIFVPPYAVGTRESVLEEAARQPKLQEHSQLPSGTSIDSCKKFAKKFAENQHGTRSEGGTRDGAALRADSLSSEALENGNKGQQHASRIAGNDVKNRKISTGAATSQQFEHELDHNDSSAERVAAMREEEERRSEAYFSDDVENETDDFYEKPLSEESSSLRERQDCSTSSNSEDSDSEEDNSSDENDDDREGEIMHEDDSDHQDEGISVQEATVIRDSESDEADDPRERVNLNSVDSGSSSYSNQESESDIQVEDNDGDQPHRMAQGVIQESSSDESNADDDLHESAEGTNRVEMHNTSSSEESNIDSEIGVARAQPNIAAAQALSEIIDDDSSDGEQESDRSMEPETTAIDTSEVGVVQSTDGISTLAVKGYQDHNAENERKKPGDSFSEVTLTGTTGDTAAAQPLKMANSALLSPMPSEQGDVALASQEEDLDTNATDDEEERAGEDEKAETEVAAVGGDFGDTTEEENEQPTSGRANRLADADRRADVLRSRGGYASQLEDGYEPEDTHGYTEEEVSEAIHTEDEEDERRGSQKLKEKADDVPQQASTSIHHNVPHSSDDMDAADEHTEHEEDLGAESSELEENAEPKQYTNSPPSEHERDPTTLLEFAQSAQRLHQYGTAGKEATLRVASSPDKDETTPLGEKSVGFVDHTNCAMEDSKQQHENREHLDNASNSQCQEAIDRQSATPDNEKYIESMMATEILGITKDRVAAGSDDVQGSRMKEDKLGAIELQDGDTDVDDAVVCSSDIPLLASTAIAATKPPFTEKDGTSETVASLAAAPGAGDLVRVDEDTTTGDRIFGDAGIGIIADTTSGNGNFHRNDEIGIEVVEDEATPTNTDQPEISTGSEAAKVGHTDITRATSKQARGSLVVESDTKSVTSKEDVTEGEVLVMDTVESPPCEAIGRQHSIEINTACEERQWSDQDQASEAPGPLRRSTRARKGHAAATEGNDKACNTYTSSSAPGGKATKKPDTVDMGKENTDDDDNESMASSPPLLRRSTRATAKKNISEKGENEEDALSVAGTGPITRGRVKSTTGRRNPKTDEDMESVVSIASRRSTRSLPKPGTVAEDEVDTNSVSSIASRRSSRLRKKVEEAPTETTLVSRRSKNTRLPPRPPTRRSNRKK